MAQQQMEADPDERPIKEPIGRAAKLAEAMRANLRRRKGQQRARVAPAADARPDAEPVEQP